VIQKGHQMDNFTTFPTPIHIFFTGLWHTGGKSKPEEVGNV